MPYVLPKLAPREPEQESPKSMTLHGARRSSVDHISSPCPPEKLRSALKGSWSTDQIDLSQSVIPSRPTGSPRPRSKSNPVSSSSKTPASPSLTAPTERARPRSKSVRFPCEVDGNLASVRFFKKRGRPVSVSQPYEETETETEGESSASSSFRYEACSGFMAGPFLTRGERLRTKFPHRLPFVPTLQLTEEPPEGPMEYELDHDSSSPVPSPTFDSCANVHLESLALRPASDLNSGTLSLVGSILVRNLSFEKSVSVRFTIDEWATTSSVSAVYSASFPSLPFSFIQAHQGSATPGDCVALLSLAADPAPWDRFTFTIYLPPFSVDAPSPVLWMAIRFSACQQEWWDNNCGRNYKVAFKLRRPAPIVSPSSPVIVEASSTSHPVQGAYAPSSMRNIARRMAKTRSTSPPALSSTFSSYSIRLSQHQMGYCNPSSKIFLEDPAKFWRRRSFQESTLIGEIST